ncbi:MAG: GC-type dockerin domain-anchored protein [Planctomycetota bacterium]
MPSRPGFVPCAAALLALPAATASAQLRVASWNITFYSGEPALDGVFRTSLFEAFEDRTFRPDVLLIQEIQGPASTLAFLDVLNGDPRGGQDWVLAEFIDGPGSIDTAVYYRASKIESAEAVLVSPGGGSPDHPRNLVRHELKLVGYDAPETALFVYNTHMKAGSSSSDESRRLDEAIAFRTDAQRLPEGTHFLLGGDLNVKRDTEPAWEKLTRSERLDSGRLFDPLASPGDWNNNPSFRFLHSQEPRSQMDDRFDQILVSDDLIDGEGLDYLGDPTTPFSTTTFEDPNHSFRTWGNDGTTFNQPIARRGNRMVGEDIADALFAHTGGQGGHLPIFLDLVVPAQIDAPAAIDLGSIAQGASVEFDVLVGNAGDADLWARDDTIAGPAFGIQPLRYSFDADARLTPPAGEFTDDAGGALNTHAIALDTSDAGVIDADLLVLSNDPDEPTRTVRVLAEVVATCRVDLDGDGSLTVFDFLAFQNLFDAGDPAADLDGDGVLSVFDFLAFQNLFDAGCP